MSTDRGGWVVTDAIRIYKNFPESNAFSERCVFYLSPYQQNTSMGPSVRIFCFTWNTESVRIAEAVQHSGQEPLSLISEKWYQCEQPDFLPALLHRVLPQEDDDVAPYDLLVFALQESAKPGDYLLSHALPRELGSRYTLLRRQRLIGAGKTTWTSLKREYEFKLRGVRIAVFVRPEFEDRVALLGDAFIPCPGRERLTHGKGGVGVVVRVVDIGVIGFLNVHLPYDASSIKGTNRMRIQTGVAQQNKALNALVDDFQERYRGIHYLFVLGDLNYRVLHRENVVDARAMYHLMSKSEEQRRRVYETRDELRQSIDYGALPLFREGVDNAGPSFMPTAKMARGREPPGTTAFNAYKLGAAFHRNPAWCDRLLYATYRDLNQTERPQRLRAEYGRVIEGDGDVRCVFYERFEAGRTMTLSDHTSVIGAFEITAYLGQDLDNEAEQQATTEKDEAQGSPEPNDDLHEWSV